VQLTADVIKAAGPTIVFCRTKHGTDQLAKRLARIGVRVEAIHGNRSQGQRERALAAFSNGKVDALAATDVTARGIHVDDVACVLPFDPANDAKDYTHRSGRTARAGREGVVATFVLWNQELDVEKLQRRLGLREPIIEVFSNDPRLANLSTSTARRPAQDGLDVFLGSSDVRPVPFDPTQTADGPKRGSRPKSSDADAAPQGGAARRQEQVASDELIRMRHGARCSTRPAGRRSTIPAKLLKEIHDGRSTSCRRSCPRPAKELAA
jgi:superfamily II DNA/RNA helicase